MPRISININMKRTGEREDPIWKKFIENKKPLDEQWQIPAAAATGAIGLGAISDIKTLRDGDEEEKTRKDDRKDKKIEHNWATHIKAPVGENEEDEEFRVVDHSLTSLGLIEEYYVDVNGFLVTMKAKDVKIVREQKHAHPPKKKKK